MMKIDMHCHILPGIDDGSASEEESLQMIQMAANQGIKSVIATPHCSRSSSDGSPEVIRQLCKEMEEKAEKKLGREFRIYPGQEVFYGEYVLEKLDKQEILTLANSSYVLVEFLPEVPYSNLCCAVRELVLAQYKPILAHVERYEALRVKGRVKELIDAGAYMQMNYSKIGGKWYEKTTRWCRNMLKEGYIHFLGTDMHNMNTRRPETIEAEAWMEKHLDNEYCRELFCENAWKVLGN